MMTMKIIPSWEWSGKPVIGVDPIEVHLPIGWVKNESKAKEIGEKLIEALKQVSLNEVVMPKLSELTVTISFEYNEYGG